MSEEEEEDGSEERRSIKNLKRIESVEKVPNDIDFSKIARKKFVNNKNKVKSSPNNQRVTLDLLTSSTVGQSRT